MGGCLYMRAGSSLGTGTLPRCQQPIPHPDGQGSATALPPLYPTLGGPHLPPTIPTHPTHNPPHTAGHPTWRRTLVMTVASAFAVSPACPVGGFTTSAWARLKGWKVTSRASSTPVAGPEGRGAVEGPAEVGAALERGVEAGVVAWEPSGVWPSGGVAAWGLPTSLLAVFLRLPGWGGGGVGGRGGGQCLRVGVAVGPRVRRRQVARWQVASSGDAPTHRAGMWGQGTRWQAAACRPWPNHPSHPNHTDTCQSPHPTPTCQTC